MVAVVSAMDLCLPPPDVNALLIQVFHDVLTGDATSKDSQIMNSLRVHLPTNIQSWRDLGRVKGLDRKLTTHARAIRKKHTEMNAIPQLNPAESLETAEFLVWLMEGKTNSFQCLSATVFSMAAGLEHVGILLRTEGSRKYETEPFVTYAGQRGPLDYFFSKHHSAECDDPYRLARGIRSRAQVISFPTEKPESMIDTLLVPRDVTNRMTKMWELGSQAASSVSVHPSAQGPFEPSSEVYYSIEDAAVSRSRFRAHVMLLADHAFPTATEDILLGLETLLQGLDPHQIQWLSQHTELEFLSKTESSFPSKEAENLHLWVQYQALVFGFYYRLFRPLLSMEHVSKDAFFRGVWGYGSTTALAAFTDLAQTFRRDLKVSRTHLLYVLSMMYGGRTQRYIQQTSGSGLLGVLGIISIISMPLYRVTDIPEEIAKFAFVDIPVIDLTSDSNGELYAGQGCDIQFDPPPAAPVEIMPRSPKGDWSAHAKMGVLFNESKPGVVMAARCNGRMVGWFSPLAADVMFLSEAYQRERHTEERSYTDNSKVTGFEIREEHWECGRPLRAFSGDNAQNTIGVVHSKGNAVLRYAAAGIFASVGEEVAIATDEIDAAVGRVDGQEAGIVIA
jgi:hypothetical protein